jgi:tetratricopeptide (TPR) repeat protein
MRMLTKGELAVLTAADPSEANCRLAEIPELSDGRRRWLALSGHISRATGAAAVDQLRLALEDLLDNQSLDPETASLVVLDLSFVATRLGKDKSIDRACAAARLLESVHDPASDVAAYTARVWLNTGNYAAFESNWDRAAEHFERALRSTHPDNWCYRFSALNYLARVLAINGQARTDLLNRANAEVPESRRPFNAATSALSDAYMAYAQKRLGEAKRLATTARGLAVTEHLPLQAVLADLCLIRLAVSAQEPVDQEVLRRLGDVGDCYFFVPYQVEKLLKGEGVTVCEPVS